MTKTNGDLVKFEFQDIDIADIPKYVPTISRSKYAALRVQIIEKINSMPSEKSFIFTTQDRQRMDPKFVDSVLTGLNNSLREEHLNWRILYGKDAKAFVVAPWKRKFGIRTKALAAAPVEPEKENGGFKDDANQRFHQLLHLVQKRFNVTLRQLQEKQAGREMSDMKAAMIYIGRNGLGLRQSDLARRLDLTDQSVASLFSSAQTRASAIAKVKELSKELNRS